MYVPRTLTITTCNLLSRLRSVRHWEIMSRTAKGHRVIRLRKLDWINGLKAMYYAPAKPCSFVSPNMAVTINVGGFEKKYLGSDSKTGSLYRCSGGDCSHSAAPLCPLRCWPVQVAAARVSGGWPSPHWSALPGHILVTVMSRLPREHWLLTLFRAGWGLSGPTQVFLVPLPNAARLKAHTR